VRRVLVTGGGTGIGRAVAEAFASMGDSVTVSGRREAPLRATAAAAGITWQIADVTDEAAVEGLFTQPYDVVVANAGSGEVTKVRDTALEAWQATIDVCLTGVFLTFREALQGMTAGGRLIAIASTASLQGAPNIASYVAAKHGVLGLVRSLAKEVAEDGITCNAVCPGFVDTPLTERAVASLAERFDVSTEEAVRRIARGNPVGRLITPQEVASAVLYLASPTAAMVNGHALAVSGGEV